MSTTGRICAKIDLSAILDNLRAMRALINENTAVIPVIKADAYGHGAVPVAKILEKEPYVTRFAVATAEEAAELIDAGISKPVMLLGGCLPDAIPLLVEKGAAFTVSSAAQAERISEEASRQKKTTEIFGYVDII